MTAPSLRARNLAEKVIENWECLPEPANETLVNAVARALDEVVREEREQHTFPFCEDSGHAICYQCAAAVRRPHEG
jgi:hypothetical protein